MSVSFLAASWLTVLPAVGLPILFHFAFRLRRRRLPFPSLVFFQRLQPRLHARKRLRDWLVLVMRCLAILAVLLALARPAWLGLGGGSNAAIAIIIDNSASMGMPGLPGSGAGGSGTSTRLANALANAGAMIADLSSSERAVILTTVRDPLVPELSEVIADKSRLRAVIDSVHETHAASASGDCLARAAAILEGSTAARREIHLFSDLQRHDWGAPPAGVPQLPRGTTLWVHRCAGTAPSSDVALAGIAVPSRGRLGGRPTLLRASLSNQDGASDVTVTLAMLDDAGHRAAQSVTVAAHGAREVPVAVPASAPGPHWTRLWIEGDAFAGDDEGFVAYRCADKRVVVLCGATGELGVLPLALAPVADGSLSGLTVQWVDAGGLTRALDATSTPSGIPAIAASPLAVSGPVMVGISWEQCQELNAPTQQALRAWIMHGGRLLLCPRAQGSAHAASLPSWLGVSGEAVHAEGGLPIVVLDSRQALFQDLVESDGTIRFPSVRVRSALVLTAEAPWTPVLGLADGRTLLTVRAFGEGSIACWGLAFSPAWSTLPLSPSFLAMVQSAALPESGDPGIVRLLAGEPPRLNAASAGAMMHITSVAGSALDLQVSAGPKGELPSFPRAGVYAITRLGSAGTASAPPLLVAVRADPGEARPELITEGAVPALGGLDYQRDDSATPSELVRRWRRSRRGVDLVPWMIVLAVAAVLLEGWIANQPLVSVRGPSANPTGPSHPSQPGVTR